MEFQPFYFFYISTLSILLFFLRSNKIYALRVFRFLRQNLRLVPDAGLHPLIRLHLLTDFLAFLQRERLIRALYNLREAEVDIIMIWLYIYKFIFFLSSFRREGSGQISQDNS